jgi:outer membrane protein OmpA-like peptidoglycan-associated protein
MQTKLLSVAIAAALLTGCGTISGGSTSEGIEATPSYLADARGNVVAHKDGCTRSSEWSKDTASAACEGGEEEKMADKGEEAEVQTAVAPPPPPPPPPPAPEAPAKVEKVVLSGRALFPYDSAELTPQGDEEMGALISKLESYQDIELVDVVGHADSRGSLEYNQALSERRAETVKGKLEASFPQVPITASGLGETAPVASNDTEEGRRLNRRVEIRVEAIN